MSLIDDMIFNGIFFHKFLVFSQKPSSVQKRPTRQTKVKDVLPEFADENLFKTMEAGACLMRRVGPQFDATCSCSLLVVLQASDSSRAFS